MLIDADSRTNTMRWADVSRQRKLWPERLDAIRCLDASDLYEMAVAQKRAGKIVFVDLEGTTNKNLYAGLYAAELVLIPMQTTQDDVIAGMQLALNHLPVIEEERGKKIPSMVVINQHDFVSGRAKVHEPLREILRESGLTLASEPIARRSAYQSIGSAGTLQMVDKPDPKAIKEIENLLMQVLDLYRETVAAAA